MRHILPFLVAALLLPGCRDQTPTITAGPPRLATEASPARQVIGAGPYVREDLEGSPRGTYAFHATLDEVGNVAGQAVIRFATIDVQVQIDIACLAIERNEAWLSGPVTASSDPAMPVGRVLLWQVQDNGDGGAPLPDRISGFAYSGTGNYAPDVCHWKYPMTTRAWENGDVRILAPAALSLGDMVGTWDVTKYICTNPANPADTQSLAGSGIRMRQTVAPDGRYTMVWWRPGPPGVIFENTRGWIDVVGGLVRVANDGSPLVIEYPGTRSGNVAFGEFDAPVCHWDDDGEEDPSHAVIETRLKRTGTLVDDLAGTWHATLFRFTSMASPALSVDLAPAGVTLTLGLDSHYTSQFGPGPGGNDEGEMIFEGDEMLTRQSEGSPPLAHSATFQVHQGIWSFTGLAEWDFDGDPATPKEPATLQAVLARQ